MSNQPEKIKELIDRRIMVKRIAKQHEKGGIYSSRAYIITR